MMMKLRSQWSAAPWKRPTLFDNEPATVAPPAVPDVAIIGGGLTGLSTAYHLARTGLRPVLFEAGLIGDGASGRTGGIVLEGTAVGILDEVDTCVPELMRLVDDEEIDCDLALPGCWEIEHPKDARAAMLPWSDDGRLVSIERTVAGGIVQPMALLIGIARAAMRFGAIIREQSPVTRINLESELSLEAGGSRITPAHLVIATNAWINATLPETPPLHSSLTFACATEPLDASVLTAIGLDQGMPFYTSDLPYLWGRPMRDGRMIFGAGLVYGKPGVLERTDVAEGDSRIVLERLEKRVRGLHPALREVLFEAAWAGPIAFTDDSIPLLGPHPQQHRVLVAGGYAGHGVALSVRAGKLLARAIEDNSPLPRWGSLVRRNRTARSS
jgi:gamma-glutamylputrescine oxidase